MTSAELDPKLRFRMEVHDAALHEKGFDVGESRPVLRIINEFMDEKIAKALKERDPLRAFEAMRDLRIVLSDLVKMGRKSFEPLLATADDGLDRAVKLMRDHLVNKYLDPDTPEEEAAQINETLVYIIEHGGWDNWRKEYNDMIWAHALDEITALRRAQAPILPWAC
jgi:hypothetical protein